MNTSTFITFPIYTNEQVKEINKKIRMGPDFTKVDFVDAEEITACMGNFFSVPCMPLMDLLYPWLNECQLINNKCFGYDINWDFHLERMNYNEYKENGKYGWHIDSTKPGDINDQKLTCLLNLSEESYEGGDFYLTIAKEKIKFGAGEGLVFNSLIAHKVTPVTKGERITLTYWGMGPSWK